MNVKQHLELSQQWMDWCMHLVQEKLMNEDPEIVKQPNEKAIYLSLLCWSVFTLFPKLCHLKQMPQECSCLWTIISNWMERHTSNFCHLGQPSKLWPAMMRHSTIGITQFFFQTKGADFHFFLAFCMTEDLHLVIFNMSFAWHADWSLSITRFAWWLLTDEQIQDAQLRSRHHPGWFRRKGLHSVLHCC